MPREYATEKKIHTGDFVMADEGFSCSCISANAVYRIQLADEIEGISILCDCGHRHYLERDAMGRLIGFYQCHPC